MKISYWSEIMRNIRQKGTPPKYFHMEKNGTVERCFLRKEKIIDFFVCVDILYFFLRLDAKIFHKIHKQNH